MSDRTILHADANSFYASVECFENPSIRNKPVVVGGSESDRRGIVLTKNILAKKYGIQTGETLYQARQKCPDLVVVPAHMEKYQKYSKLVKLIFADYTDQSESYGIDESWLDCTGSVALFGSGETIANEIRQRVFDEVGITVSVGVSFNKVFAKLGSDMRKPNFTTCIPREHYKEIVWPLPASDLLFVGPKTTLKLARYGIRTIGDLANAEAKFIYSLLGHNGLQLHKFANGQDNSPVSSLNDAAYVNKSVGNSITAPRDLTTIDDVRAMFYMLSDSVAERLRAQNAKCKTVQITVRDKTLFSCERQGPLEYPTFISAEIAEKAIEIFSKKYRFSTPLRSIGVRGCDLVHRDTIDQINLFTDMKLRDKWEKVEIVGDAIRAMYGYHKVKRGILFVDNSLTFANAREEHTIHPVGLYK